MKPTEPGFYWYKTKRGWEIVSVYQSPWWEGATSYTLKVGFIGIVSERDIADCHGEWGERIKEHER